MMKKICALFMSVFLAGTIICGCGSDDRSGTKVPETADSGQTEEGPSEQAEDDVWCQFGNGIGQEEFADKLDKLDISQDTLAVGVDTDYSPAAVRQINQMLKEKGYDFKVVFCRIPDACLLNGAIVDTATTLKDTGVAIDILPVWKDNIKKMAQRGLLTDLTSQIESDSGLKGAYPEKYWSLTAVDGKNYGSGSYYVSPNGWAVNKKLMEKYGFEPEDLAKDIAELEGVFDTVTAGEKTSEFAAFVYEPRFFMETIPFSYVDDTLPVGYWMGEASGDIQAVDLFDTDEMKKLVETMNDYYKKGYVQVGYDEISPQEVFFMQSDLNGFPIRRSDGLDCWSNAAGIDLVRIPYYEKTADCIHFEISAIPSWSVKKEKAWEFLKFICEDEEASALLQYGVKDEDYTVSAGTAKAGDSLTEDIIFNRCLGNLQAAAPLSPYEDDSKQELCRKELDTLSDSQLSEFVFDPEPVLKEVEAVRELYMELSVFRQMFAFEPDGTYENWREYYDAYHQQLKDAGIDRVTEEMNRQIQEYRKK